MTKRALSSVFRDRILSGDPPRSVVLTAILTLIILGLAAAPFVFSGALGLNTAAKILIFIVVVASYDLMLGYGGIVSFAHTMFFGIGAYGVAIALSWMGASWTAIAVGTGCALAVSAVLATVIGLFSLRVRTVFFAMITLAVATAFTTLMSQLSQWTGGEDGISFKVPAILSPAYRLVDQPVAGIILNGRVITYYILFVVAVALFLVMLRIVNSPFGRVLQALRENSFRAEAIGYRTIVYRMLANLFAALFATLAGVLMALWLRYNGPDTTLSLEIMIDILLMIVIGGMGTLYGAIIGAALFMVTQTYLQAILAWANSATQTVPVLSQLTHPDRWLLWLGLLFILSVYYFPEGIIGKLRTRARS